MKSVFILVRIWSVFFLMTLSQTGFGQIFASQTEGCAPLVGVDFGHTFGVVTGILWNFGDGSSATVNSPSHTFQDPGVYTVTFTANGGISETIQIEAFAHPVAIFSLPEPNSGCLPFTISCVDESTAANGATLETWTWDFGDGGVIVGGDPNPSYTYTLIGVNDISLVVEDNNGCESSSLMMNAVTTSIPPSVELISFPAATSACNPPLQVDFNTVASSNSPLTDALDIFWDMGNGTTNTVADPIAITYTALGTYPVILEVTDDIGCVNSQTIDVFIGSPQAEWELIGGPNFCDLVTVVNTSDAAQTTVNWGDLFVIDYDNGAPDTLTHSYLVPGTYTASITTSAPGCQNTDFVEIIIEDVQASFTSSPNFSCIDTLQVTYVNTSAPMQQYMWTFPGNPDTLYGTTAIFTHQSPGSEDPYFYDPLVMFGATLTVTSASGCMESTTIFNDSIMIPYSGFYVNQHEGCAPLTISFSDTSDAVTDIVNWQWVFDDGTVIDLDNMDDPIEHTYTQAGEYSPYLIITTENGCTDTSFVIPVSVGTPLSPGVNLSPVQVCPNEPVDFSTITNGNVDYWNIVTDGGQFSSCSTEAAGSDGFSSSAGFHDVTVMANYNGCISETTLIDAIEVLGPIGHFYIETDCSAPFTINCIGSITGASSWTYDFGDGNTFISSADQNITHTYATTGDYLVTLTSVASTGCPPFEESFLVHIRDVSASVTNNLSSCEGADFTLNGSNSVDVEDGMVESYLWIFDSGLNIAPFWTTAPNPSIEVGASGAFEVQLVVQDINGCRDTANTTFFAYDVDAAFEMDIDSYCMPLEVQFNDLSVSDTTIVGWSWNFGNGTFSNDQFPSQTYTNGSFFEITLTTTNAIGCTDDFWLTVMPDIPNANFTISDGQTCSGDSITFNPNVTSYTSYDWGFEDGQSADLSNPTIAFDEAGSYDATLTVINAAGCSQVSTMFNAVTVQDYPLVGFNSTVDELSHICYPILIEFTDTSLASVFDYRDWDLGTAAPVVSAATVGTIYEAPGTYTVSLEVGTTFGCVSSVSKEYLIEGPVGDFTMSDDAICIYDAVTLELLDTIGVTSFLWDFGNGADSANVNPITYTYNELPSGGSTVLQLVMWSGDFTCSYTTQHPFTVNQTIADFDRNNELLLEDTVHCFGVVDQFNNQSWDATNFHWDFDDLYYSSAPNPSHLYQAGGTYDITLYASNVNTGCADTITKSVTVFPKMNVGTEDGLACLGDTIQLSAYGGYQYLWSPEDEVSDANIQNPIIFDDIDHELTVLVTDTNECSKLLYLDADFIRPPPEPSWTDTILDYGQILDFQYPNEEYHYYYWANEIGTICSTCGTNGFTPVNDHIYTLIVTDQLHCFVDTFQFGVQVLADLPFFMPNAFTPNEDGLNDQFFPVTSRAMSDDYEFTIWNRHGEQIWKTNDLAGKWAGPPKGSQYYSQNEVYIWTVRIRDLKQVMHVFKGTVTAVR